MKVKKLEISRYIMGSKSCTWSSLNAPGTETPLSHSILRLDDFPVPSSTDTEFGGGCPEKLVCFVMSKDPEERTPSEADLAKELSDASQTDYDLHAAAVIGGLGRRDLCDRSYPR